LFNLNNGLFINININKINLYKTINKKNIVEQMKSNIIIKDESVLT